jgi:hypothetical protein
MVKDAIGVDYNLVDCIGPSSKNVQLFKGSKMLTFPAEYNNNSTETRNKLIKYIRVAASEAGFALVCGRTHEKENRFVLTCFRHSKHRPTEKTRGTSGKIRNTSTQRARDDDSTCPFNFTIRFDSDANLWYIFCGFGNASHKGHFQKWAVDVRNSAAYIHEDEIQIAKDMAKVNMNASAIQALVLERNGILLSKAATAYIRAIEKETNATTEEGAKLTAAEQILSYVQWRQDVSYFVVYDDPKSPLITIPNTSIKLEFDFFGKTNKKPVA